MRNKFYLWVAAIAVSLSAQGSIALKTVTQYWVPPGNPTGGSQLYPVKDSGISIDGEGNGVLQLRLPEDLVGANSELFILKEVPSCASVYKQYSNGEVFASCLESGKNTRCVMRYPGDYRTTIQGTEVDAFLSKKFQNDPKLLQQKLAQSLTFRGDPEGVFLIFRQ